MSKLDFSIPISQNGHHYSLGLDALETADSYLDVFSEKKGQLVSESGNTWTVTLIDTKPSITPLKVISYFTLILPLLALLAKLILRCVYEFKVTSVNTNSDIKIPSILTEHSDPNTEPESLPQQPSQKPTLDLSKKPTNTNDLDIVGEEELGVTPQKIVKTPEGLDELDDKLEDPLPDTNVDDSLMKPLKWNQLEPLSNPVEEGLPLHIRFASSGPYFKGMRGNDLEKEIGIFGKKEKEDKHTVLLSGYKLKKDCPPEFISPRTFAQSSPPKYSVVEYEGELTVLDGGKMPKMTVEEVLNGPINSYMTVEKLLSSFTSDDVSLSPYEYGAGEMMRVLKHRYFDAKTFIQKICSSSATEVPQIFQLGSTALSDVLKFASEQAEFDPLKVIHPTTGKNILLHIASRTQKSPNAEELLITTIHLFPQQCAVLMQNILIELLQTNDDIKLVRDVANELLKQIKEPNDYQQLLNEILGKNKFKEKYYCSQSFIDRISALSDQQQQIVYDIASITGTKLYPQAEPTSIPDTYSINLFFDNEEKESFSNNASLSSNIVNYIYQWAEKHPGKSINIWLDDDAMCAYWQTKLQANATPTTISLKNLQTLTVVQQYPNLLKEGESLLPSAVSKELLEKEKDQILISLSKAILPLSSQELFDKKTIHSLNYYGFVRERRYGAQQVSYLQILNGKNAKFLEAYNDEVTIGLQDKSDKKANEIIENCYKKIFNRVKDPVDPTIVLPKKHVLLNNNLSITADSGSP